MSPSPPSGPSHKNWFSYQRFPQVCRTLSILLPMSVAHRVICWGVATEINDSKEVHGSDARSSKTRFATLAFSCGKVLLRPDTVRSDQGRLLVISASSRPNRCPHATATASTSNGTSSGSCCHAQISSVHEALMCGDAKNPAAQVVRSCDSAVSCGLGLCSHEQC